MIRIIAILCLSGLLSLEVLAQTSTIRIDAVDQPLNELLLKLRDQYKLQLSFSDNQLARYSITASKTFPSIDEALKFLFDDLPFQLKKSGEVWVIIPDKKKTKPTQARDLTRISGQIVEAGSYEPLPFSQILINNHPMIADVTGSFNYTATSDSAYRVRISHLGYYIYDTLLYASINQRFRLFPSTKILPEILVQNTRLEKATMVGEKAGKVSINHNIARFLPGQGDNSVFNLIRLMPGIQAAGEQSGDLMIWGSYEGHSLVTFDEFTLFGLKNYNDNISAVNPFLVKNIEILKGGFDARFGNRVGGIVNITAKNGNMQKPVFSLNVNPTTINGMLEVPLFQKSSLLLAYRQTYYQLFESGDFNFFTPVFRDQGNKSPMKDHRNISFDLDVYPDKYQFRDMNLKYTFNFANGDQFFASLYGGGDYFSLIANANTIYETKKTPSKISSTPISLNLTDQEENRQFGASLFYHRKWSDRLITKIVATNSDFSKTQSDDIYTKNQNTNKIYNKDLVNTRNDASEQSLRIENISSLLDGHQLEFGGGLFVNKASIKVESNLTDTLSIKNEQNYRNSRMFAYVNNIMPVSGRLSLNTGLRLTKLLDNGQWLVEPRISSTYRISDEVKINASWGKYRQIQYKIANVDRNKNYTYLWIVAQNQIPILDASHWVAELNYFKNDFTFNLQTYYKSTANLSQRVFEIRPPKMPVSDGYRLYFGSAKTYGIDVYAKKEFGPHSVWASYTLSKAYERFAPASVQLPEYSLAPQHQLHEFKAAGLFNVRQFYFSSNFIYGSGLEILQKVFNQDNDNVSYHRLDVSATYKFAVKKISGELGFSVLNVFNSQNLRYDNLKNFQLSADLGDFRVYSSSVPFTPVLFLKFVF